MVMTPVRSSIRRGPSPRTWLTVAAVTSVQIAAGLAWFAPRDDIALPGLGATPEQVVTAYLDAVNARDFDTAKVLDDRPPDRLPDVERLGRFSRPGRAHDVRIVSSSVDEWGKAHVTFTADFSGGDGTIDELWGYFLRRNADGDWRIIQAGASST